MTKVAIMQPYAFPYIGYFQLINAVDLFLLLDDVTYIKKGWINRNRILGNKDALVFTIPLLKPSQNKHIRDTKLNPSFSQWRKRFLKTLTHTYKKAPYFEQSYKLIDSCVCESTDISSFCFASLNAVASYLGCSTSILSTSSKFNTKGLKAETKILSLCEQLEATEYYNLSGGKELYSFDEFKKRGIKLKFISSKPISYPQFKNPHQPWLSIIDILMFNSVEEIKTMIEKVNIEEE